jgi:hypothetical protein
VLLQLCQALKMRAFGSLNQLRFIAGKGVNND